MSENTSLIELGLPTIVENALENFGLRTVGDIERMSDEELLLITNISHARVAQIHEAIQRQKRRSPVRL